MSAPEAPKITLGQKIGGGLVAVLLVSLALMVLGPLLGVGFTGLVGSVDAVGAGANSTTQALGNAQVSILGLMQRLLQIAFSILATIALGAFLVFLFKKILKALKDDDDGHGGGHGAAHPPAAPHP